MNERTQELIEQFATNLLNRSGYDMREYEPFLEEAEKFAELILQECVNMCHDIADPHLYRNQDICQRLAPGASYAAKVIKFRFGVEE